MKVIFIALLGVFLFAQTGLAAAAIDKAAKGKDVYNILGGVDTKN